LNGRLNAVSVRKPPEWMSNFWTVQFFKTESEPNFNFPRVPTLQLKRLLSHLNCLLTDRIYSNQTSSFVCR